MSWTQDEFEIAFQNGPMMVAGYTYRGLGLHVKSPPSKNGKRPPHWTLSHLGTGHGLAVIVGRVATAFPIASEIAEAGDWDFLSLVGWKDRFPDVAERLREICEGRREVTSFASGHEQRNPKSHEIAQQIARDRP